MTASDSRSDQDPHSPTGSADSDRREAYSGSVDLAQSLAGDFHWSVYPVNRRKLPVWSKASVYPNGSKDASTDEETIKRLWTPYPDALVAVRLDYSNLVCIDIDRHEGVNGIENFQILAQKLGPLPVTVAQRSVSGNGFHGIFKAPGCEIRMKLATVPGVDFLHHGYFVVNEWMRGQSPWEREVASLPQVWVDFLRVEPKKVTERSGDSDDILRTISPVSYVYDIAALTPDRRGFVSCPGHEDWKPSLKVYDTAEAGWFCYQCQRGGSIYDFMALTVGLDQSWGSDRIVAAQIIEIVTSLYEELWDIRSE